MTVAVEPTERELEILRLYLELGSVAGVAWRLRLSVRTIKVDLANVRAKVGAKTIAEAVFVLHDLIETAPKDG